MSLDVYLSRKKRISYDDGETYTEEMEEVYWANITHNLGTMAEMAGIYKALWRPEEIGILKAVELVPIIEKGFIDMKERMDYYKQFDASNGWGTYEHFIPFIENYLSACKRFPDASVDVSR